MVTYCSCTLYYENQMRQNNDTSEPNRIKCTHLAKLGADVDII